MVFNSLIFLFLFLPVVYVLYSVASKWAVKRFILVVFSLLFYSWGSPSSLVLMIITIGWNYLTGLELELYEGKKRKVIFTIGIIFHGLILILYKYVNFIFGFMDIQVNLTLPVGLSFFTFSAISYLCDVYMKKCNSQNNFISLSLYISFFGKVSMGPIVQYHDMEDALSGTIIINRDGYGYALQRIIKGLVKKVIVADQLSLMYTSLLLNNSILGTWLCSVAYMLQIYFDFSGYSDMAIGISRLFGFTFDENFDHPYIADSIQNFWRRWHISLSRWFRDYIYIPLGGSRVSNNKYIRNIFVVWLFTGIWHGASWNFVFWGLYYGVLLLVERFIWKDRLSAMPSLFRHTYTLLLVLIGWIFFYSPTLSDAFIRLGRMVGLGAYCIVDKQVLFLLKQNILLLAIGVLFSTPFFDRFELALIHSFKKKSIAVVALMWIIMFLISIAFIVSSTFQSFLYFAF